MRIVSLEITDYNVIAQARVDFDALPSVVMVAGKVRAGGASSNGAGKSSVFDALCWGLFGEELRKRKKGRIVRKGQPSCHVKVTVKLDSGKTMIVERHRKRSGATEVVIDGKRTSTATGGQEEIDRRLGFTFDLFTRTVVFGGNFSSFCRMSPAERTRLLEELLGVGHYLNASEIARERLRTTEDELSRLREKHATRQERLVQLRGDYLSFVESAGLRDARQCRELSRLYGEGARLVQRIEAASYRLGIARRGTEEAREKHRQAVQKWRERLVELDVDMGEAQKKLREATGEAATAEAEEKIAQRELKDAMARDKSRVCPTCKRPFDAHEKPVDLSPFTEKVEQLLRILGKRRMRVQRAEADVNNVRLRIQSHRDTEPQPPKVTAEVERLQSRLAELEGEWAAVAKQTSTLEASDPAEESREEAARVLRDWFALRSKGDRASEKRELLARDVEMLRFWQFGFGRDGIPSMLLESTAPALNKSVKPLADILTDSAYTIEFKGVQSGQRTDFRVNVSNVDGGDSYDDLSKGELVRVDLCVLFAIRQLMMDRASVKCDQIFIDELLDGLDEQGMEHAARLLRSQKIAKQTIYISHADALKDAADGVITVVKKGGVSRIKQ